MKYLTEVFMDFTEFLCFYYSLRFFASSSLKPKAGDFVTPVISIAVNLLLPQSSPALLILGQCILIAYAIYIFKGFSPVDRVSGYILSFASIYILQIVVIIIFSLFKISFEARPVALSGNLIVLVLLIAISKIRHIASVKIKSIPLLIKMLLINSYFIMLLILTTQKDSSSLFYRNLIIYSLVLLMIIVSNTLVLLYDNKYERERNMREYYETNLPIYKALLDDIAIRQHEYNNRLNSIMYLPNVCKTNEELVEKLKEYTTSLHTEALPESIIHLGSPLISATLFMYYQEAKKKGIHFFIDVPAYRLPEDFAEYEVSDYFSILVKNAVEACPEGGSVTITLAAEYKLLFEITNTTEQAFTYDEIKKWFLKGYSTKGKGNRGVGLYLLTHDIKKYHGKIDYSPSEIDGKKGVTIKLVLG